MIDKRTLSLMIAAAAFSVSLYTLARAASYRPADKAAGAPAESAVSVTDTFTPKVIRLWNGRAAVFEPGSTEPEKVLEADIESFPEEVWERLRKGIFIYSREQYINYLEDFS